MVRADGWVGQVGQESRSGKSGRFGLEGSQFNTVTRVGIELLGQLKSLIGL